MSPKRQAPKIHINFHNPNASDDFAKHLYRLLAEEMLHQDILQTLFDQPSSPPHVHTI